MKSRPCGWVFRLSRVSRAVRERHISLPVEAAPPLQDTVLQLLHPRTDYGSTWSPRDENGCV